MNENLTTGSLFSGGVDGFSTGFEAAGWRTLWQCEINPTFRACLADRFPHARQFSDVRTVGARNLEPVHCLTFGSPCQGNTVMGNVTAGGRRGLDDAPSGLFFEGSRVLREIRPQWVVFENVPGLLNVNGGRDFARVLWEFSQCGYAGFWRVLDARYFGVAQGRRRLFVVLGLGRQPHMDFLADAGSVAAVSRSFGAMEGDARTGWASYTLTAPRHDNRENSRYNLGSENFVAHEDGWRAMLERARATEVGGFCRGLSPCDIAEAGAAGNSVCPQIAAWIARILARSEPGEAV